MARSLYVMLRNRYGTPVTQDERRAFLKASLAVGAGLMIGGLGAPALGQGKPSGRRVVVIGGGFAGLACASELVAGGADVTVVEARGRLGGRILSFKDMVPGATVEGGGELIGSNHPAWVAYAERFGLEFSDVSDYELDYPVILNGKRLEEAKGVELWEQLDEATALMNEMAKDLNADEAWLSKDAAALDKRSIAQWIGEQKVDELTKVGLRVLFEADNGQAAEKQSLLCMLAAVKGGGLEKFWSESEVYRCKGGNQQLAEKLAETVGMDRIIMGLSAKAVSLGGNGKPSTVTCGDGRTIECDEIVLAVPPTVWKKIEMKPGLPAGLMPQMGSNVKYLAALKGPFWEEKGLAPDALSDGEISMTWNATDQQDMSKGAVMVGFSGGPASEKCRTRKGKEADEAYTKNFEAIYPGFAAARTGGRFMDWPGDTWSGASYSFPAPGEVTTAGPMLRKGLPGLHFAGEHCSYAFIGYMEGALQSGIAAAKRILAKK